MTNQYYGLGDCFKSWWDSRRGRGLEDLQSSPENPTRARPEEETGQTGGGKGRVTDEGGNGLLRVGGQIIIKVSW